MAPILSAMLFLVGAARAQGPAEAASGYVVKAGSAGVYLDFGAASGASAGQPFTIYTEGAELIHPKTGKSLGREETTVAQGTIREVFEQYSIGDLAPGAASVAQGMRARLGKAQVATATGAVAPAMPSPGTGRQPKWRSPALDFSISAMAIADFEGKGGLSAALAQTKKVLLYPYPFSDAKPLAEFTHPGVNVKIVSLEAADLAGDGRARLFVSLYNQNFERFETVVLEYDGKELKKDAEIPGVVRSYQDETGRRIMAVQQLSEDSTFPFAKIYQLAYKDGKYSAGAPVEHPTRLVWVFDFTEAKLDGSAAVLSLSNTDRLRVQFAKGSPWRSPDTFGQTPVRVAWQGRLIDFHPPMPVRYVDGLKAQVYLAHNISKLGMLSEPFGFFERGEIHRKSWNGVALEDDWKADIGGYCTGLVLASPGGRPELAAAVVSASGKSSVWTYDP